MRNGPRLRAISIMYSFFSKKIQKIVFDLQKFHKSEPTSVGFNWKKKDENVFYMILKKKKFWKKNLWNFFFFLKNFQVWTPRPSRVVVVARLTSLKLYYKRGVLTNLKTSIDAKSEIFSGDIKQRSLQKG